MLLVTYVRWTAVSLDLFAASDQQAAEWVKGLKKWWMVRTGPAALGLSGSALPVPGPTRRSHDGQMVNVAGGSCM
uniref:Uncharacterized protein n=1 Tax=Arundo donax TaxID=35708 RepID=A0A0A9AYR3_ARUDO